MFLLPQKQKWKLFWDRWYSVVFRCKDKNFYVVMAVELFQVFFSVLHRPFQRENYQVESINHVRFVHAIGNIKG